MGDDFRPTIRFWQEFDEDEHLRPAPVPTLPPELCIILRDNAAQDTRVTR